MTKDDRPPRYIVDYEDDALFQRLLSERGEAWVTSHPDLFTREYECNTLAAARRFARTHSAATIYERVNIVDYWRDGIRCWQWDTESVE